MSLGGILISYFTWWSVGWWIWEWGITGINGPAVPYGFVGAPMGPAWVPAARGKLNGGGVPAAKPCLSNAWK